MSEQIRPRDPLACCWDVKQPTNKPCLRPWKDSTRPHTSPGRFNRPGCRGEAEYQNKNISHCIENPWVLCSTQRNINKQWWAVAGGRSGPGQWRRLAACGLALIVRLIESFWRRDCNVMQQVSTRQQIVYNNPESTRQYIVKTDPHLNCCWDVNTKTTTTKTTTRPEPTSEIEGRVQGLESWRPTTVK